MKKDSIDINEQAKIKVWVFHPMQQHSYKTAEALLMNNLLDAYWTSVYYQPNRTIYKILNLILDKSNIKRMRSRRKECLDSYVRTSSTLLGLLFILSGKIDKSGKLSNYFQYALSIQTGKKIAKCAIREKVDIIIGYDTWSHGLIKELKKNSSKIKVVVDYSSLYAEEILQIINKDIQNNTSIHVSYKKTLAKYAPKYIKAFCYEKNFADYYLSPSSVVDNSLCNYGADKQKIFRCTYGGNFERTQVIDKNYTTVTFIYVGRMSCAKGVHYLLKAFNSIKRKDCKLILVGPDTDNLAKKITNPNIKYVGLVNHDEIPKYLLEADVVISASLYDGFSLAILEAAAYNLPIMCTKNIGAVDYVTKKTGLSFDIQSAEQIENAVAYLLENKQLIRDMSRNVGHILDNLTWENYAKEVQNAMCFINED